jgi:hypothetical protein
MPLFSCQGPGTTVTYEGSAFLLPGFCWRCWTAECREPGVDRALFLLIEGTIYFSVNFNRLWQFPTRKLPYWRPHYDFFSKQLALPSALNTWCRHGVSYSSQN